MVQASICFHLFFALEENWKVNYLKCSDFNYVLVLSVNTFIEPAVI